VPTDDLSSIPGLEDKHLPALARLQITDLRREAEVEAPVAADALPQPSPEFDAEADLEGLVALDDGV
jgi:hypothetical protein